MQHGVTFIIGMLLGGVAAICIWTLISYVRNRTTYRIDDHRDRVMSAVEKKWTEIDTLLSSYRDGKVDEFSFRSSLAEMMETINRIYKPALHLLDVFFVKYTEKLLEDYGRMIASPNREEQPFDNRGRYAPVPETQQAAAAHVATADEEQLAAQAPEEVTDASDTKVEPFSTEPVNPPERIIPQELPAEDDAGVETIQMTPLQIEEPVVNDAGVETIQMTSHQIEEPIVEDLVAAQKSEEELPLETFLEMETGAGFADDGVEMKTDIQTQERAPEPESSPEATRLKEPLYSSQVEAKGTDRQKFIAPSPPPRSSVPPPQRPVLPVLGNEEITQPATIFDVEAETIIADRNTIIGSQAAPAGPEDDKKTLGITGDDVIKTFDKLFGIKH